MIMAKQEKVKREKSKSYQDFFSGPILLLLFSFFLKKHLCQKEIFEHDAINYRLSFWDTKMFLTAFLVLCHYLWI